jgi:hypothetical protein
MDEIVAQVSRSVLIEKANRKYEPLGRTLRSRSRRGLEEIG